LKRLPVVFAAAAACAVLALWGCRLQSPEYADTVWDLRSIMDTAAEKQVIEGSEVTLLLGRDGDLSGSGGCNTYTGSYTASGDGRIAVRELVWTEKACLEPAGIMEQETAYLSALGSAGCIDHHGTELTIESGGGTRLHFAARLIETVHVSINFGMDEYDVQLSHPVKAPLQKEDAMLIMQECGCVCTGEPYMKDDAWYYDCCDEYPDCSISIDPDTGTVECEWYG